MLKRAPLLNGRPGVCSTKYISKLGAPALGRNWHLCRLWVQTRTQNQEEKMGYYSYIYDEKTRGCPDLPAPWLSFSGKSRKGTITASLFVSSEAGWRFEISRSEYKTGGRSASGFSPIATVSQTITKKKAMGDCSRIFLKGVK